jgi:membrane-associated phospholipid phosphatase
VPVPPEPLVPVPPEPLVPVPPEPLVPVPPDPLVPVPPDPLVPVPPDPLVPVPPEPLVPAPALEPPLPESAPEPVPPLPALAALPPVPDKFPPDRSGRSSPPPQPKANQPTISPSHQTGRLAFVEETVPRAFSRIALAYLAPCDRSSQPSLGFCPEKARPGLFGVDRSTGAFYLAPMRSSKTQAWWTLVLPLVLLWTSESATQDSPHALANTGAGFLALETGGTLVMFAAYSIAAGDPPEQCSWCEPTGFDTAVRDALVMENSRPPATVSHVLSLGVIPFGGFAALLAPAMGHDKTSYALADGWIMLNVAILTTGLTDGTKTLVGRQRPAFHHGRQSETEFSDWEDEANRSFFSGDTAWAFSFASSAATLAYLRGYETAPYIALGGGTLALTTGVLRIAADVHWATDVMAGAVVGTGVGIGLPLLLHPRKSDSESTSVSAAPLAGEGLSGVMFSGTF